MAGDRREAGDYARILLAAIRLFNGAAAVAAPEVFARRLGADPPNREIVYALRLFGVRTVLIGNELLSSDGDVRARALRIAPLIHAADAAVALLAARGGQLRGKAARAAVAVSATNTALALIAHHRRR